jgi:hypothetical protein
MTQTKYKNDIFAVLGQANNKNAEYFENLPEDQQKALQPLLIQRWLTGTESARQVFMINEIVNPFVFSLFRHKQLLWQLITICTPGKFQKYTWTSQKTDKHSKPVSAQIVSQYYKYSAKHAKDAVKLLTYDQVVELAHQLGAQQDTITKIKKEFDVNGSRSK